MANLGAKGTILIVEDDEELAQTYQRMFQRMGLASEWLATSEDACARLASGPSPALVLTDLGLGDGNGREVLETARVHHPVVQVIVATGTARVEEVVELVELGAYRLLTKPIDLEKLRETVSLALQGAPPPSITALRTAANARDAVLRHQLDAALDQVFCLFQPIVDVRQRKVFAYEALLRTRHPSYRSPLPLLADAARLDRGRELSRRIRASIAQTATTLPAGALLFVNLLADDLGDPQLLSADDPLHPFAGRIVLELTEQTRLNDRVDVKAAIGRLRELGYRVAIDDLGAGYSSLALLVELAPDFVKLDMSLVRGVDGDEVRQQIVGAMLQVCARKRSLAVLEGVETASESDALQNLGARWMQGYLFAKPSPPFVDPFV